MRQIAIFVVFALQLMAPTWAMASDEVPVLAFHEVREGMKGYGISVFHGQKPEKFQVEVIGVLPNELPTQSLILVRLSGMGLERSRTVAGMSGSPIYLEGKLAGAVSYAWGFAMDPIAGVTPIEDMLEDLQRDEHSTRELLSHNAVRRVWEPYTRDGNLGAAIQRLGAGKRAVGGDSLPVAMPMILPQMPPALKAEFEAGFRGIGMVPVGGSALSGKGAWEGEVPPVPGGVLGLAYLLGDINMSGVGTITYVDGHRMVGFGHPMMQSGATDFPIVAARIVTVLSSRNLSVKMAETGSVIGQLTGDFQASVVGRYDTRSKLVPLKVHVRAPELHVDRHFNMQVAPMPTTLPLIVAAGFSGVLSQALPHALPFLYQIAVSWEVEEGFSGTYEKVTVANNKAGSSLLRDALMPVILVLGNPYRDLTLKSLEITLDVVPRQRVAELRAVSIAVDEVYAGEELSIKVYLRPFGHKGRVVEEISLKIPRAFAGKNIKVEVGSAENLLTPQRAEFVDLPTYLEDLSPVGRADELVAVLSALNPSLDADGVLYPAAPPSLRASVSRITVDTSAKSLYPEYYSKKPLKWILENTATLRVDVLRPRS